VTGEILLLTGPPGAGKTTTAGIAALHRQFADLGPLERHVLLVGGLGREAVLAAVGTAMEGGKFRLA
jgi:adenylylsulfate kinase-like enzyme